MSRELIMNSKTELTGDPNGRPHREIDPITGRQLAYVVLTKEERAKGFVEPVRQCYVHEACGMQTVISKVIAETFAREPEFYTGTFCSHCKKHFPVGEEGEFVWNNTKQKVGTRS